MQKNGKNKKCKTCSKEFYVAFCNLKTKKYCSKKCAKDDNFGFKERKKYCVICKKSFFIKTGIQVHKKTCSLECQYTLRRKISDKSVEKRKKTPKKYKCKGCSNYFVGNEFIKRKYCTLECQYNHYKKIRIGKQNPAFRSGDYAKNTGKLRKGKQGIHLNACLKYRKYFNEKNEYLFCEVCKINKNGTKRFEVHHIYYASRYPKHKELHNFKNLIHICIECHNKFHKEEYKEVFKKIEKERGLKELFGCNVKST
jgi:hypothetical protein